jgi:adenine-specific DNA-methyltransferase
MTFKCDAVAHVTLRRIARSTALDPLFAKHEPILADRLKALNAALRQVSADSRKKLSAKLLEIEGVGNCQRPA